MKNNEKNINKKTKIRNDIILTAVILAIAAAGLFLLNSTKKEGNSVTVKIDGKQTAVFSLYEDLKYEIRTGEEQEDVNILIIEKGKAYISYADCPDGICKDYRPVSFVGETIVCLPHKVVIEVTGQTADSGLDIVA